MLYREYFTDELSAVEPWGQRRYNCRVEAMKRFLPMILLFFAIPCLGQNNSEAILVDKFGQIPCDEFKARVDNFYIQINANPGSHGYFVINGSKEFLTEKLDVELLFESAVQTRRYDRTRTTIVRGHEGGPFEVDVWMVKAGSDTPDLGETKWDLRMPPSNAPFLLRSDMAQICDPPPIGRVATDLLNSNPDGAIFVVVHGPTSRRHQTELGLARRMLAGFDPARIRYLLRYSPIYYSDYYFALGKPKRTDFKSYF